MTWLDGAGLPTAFSVSSVLFGGTLLGGCVVLIAAWAAGKHASSRYVREYAFADRP
jgi:hypothetical protein